MNSCHHLGAWVARVTATPSSILHQNARQQRNGRTASSAGAHKPGTCVILRSHLLTFAKENTLDLKIRTGVDMHSVRTLYRKTQVCSMQRMRKLSWQQWWGPKKSLTKTKLIIVIRVLKRVTISQVMLRILLLFIVSKFVALLLSFPCRGVLQVVLTCALVDVYAYALLSYFDINHQLIVKEAQVTKWMVQMNFCAP